MVTENDVAEAIQRILYSAAEARNNAAYAGAYHDGGAQRTEDIVEAYLYGLRGQVPPWLQNQIDAMKAEETKDLKEYERLRKKYGDKQ